MDSADSMKARVWSPHFIKELWFLALAFAVPFIAQAQFSFETNNGTLTVTGYSGPEVASVVIPATTNGMPIVSIGQSAFAYRNITGITIPEGVITIADSAFFECLLLRSVTIPDSVVSLGPYSFSMCTNLMEITIGRGVRSIGDYGFKMLGWPYVLPEPMHFHFRGDAPQLGISVFQPYVSTIYYLPGTVGWGSTFGDMPAEPWVLPNPLILDFGPSFGVQGGQFGFIISWATNVDVVIEVSTDLQGAQWVPLVTNTLNQGSVYFSDAQWMDYPDRFYRVRSE
jgi:hypothetical protein